MKAAYAEEVSNLTTKLEAAKMSLETWYAKRIEDKDIVDEVKETYDSLMNLADNELNQFTGSMKSIRTAMATQQVMCIIYNYELKIHPCFSLRLLPNRKRRPRGKHPQRKHQLLRQRNQQLEKDRCLLRLVVKTFWTHA